MIQEHGSARDLFADAMSTAIPAAARFPGFPSPPEQQTRPVRLAAVVVTYNRLEQIRRTLSRLLTEPCERIYIIDNGSTDGTREWLAELVDDRVRVILTASNLGGAGGFELGMRRATREDDPDWVVIMDDDARPYAGCLGQFLRADLSAWDAVSAAVFLGDGRICEMNRPTLNPFWHTPTFLRTMARTCVGRARGGFHVPDAAYAAGPAEIDASSFCGLFLSRAAIARVGFPDGNLFIYGDDVLYTLRLRKAGLKLGFLPDLRFEHEHNQGYNGCHRVYHPVWKAYYTARNGLLVYRMAAGILFWPAMICVLLKWLIAGRRYRVGRSAYYRMMWHGLKDGIVGRRNRPHSEITSLALGKP